MRALGSKQQALPYFIRQAAVGSKPAYRLARNRKGWRIIVIQFGIRPLVVD